MPERYRKKPVEIEAMRFDGKNHDDVFRWADGYPETPTMWIESGVRGMVLIIRTLEGDMAAGPGDWVIRGVKGELYPCKADIFELTYEPAEVAGA